MTRINPLPQLILAAFATFLVVFILSLYVSRSAERLDACAAGMSRFGVNAPVAEPLHTVEAIRIAFADRAHCPSHTAIR